jgi:hypothetical protein
MRSFLRSLSEGWLLKEGTVELVPLTFLLPLVD